MITDFYEAWRYLCEHPYFENKMFKKLHKDEDFFVSMFPSSLEVEVHKVNPMTSSIDDDDFYNTKTEVWLECGEHYFNNLTNQWEMTHNADLDCGGSTFEEAIIKLANIIRNKTL